MTSPTTPTAERITEAAMGILREQGRSAVTVRAVATAAGVQAPAIYRAFGDMYGLFASVATAGFHTYLERKRTVRETDPVSALRAAWDVHVQFGLDEPGLYLLMYGDPTRITSCDAAAEAWAMLVSTLEAIDRRGELAVPVSQAADMVHGTSMGITLTLLGKQPDQRDPSLATAVREATFAAVLRGDALPIASAAVGAANSRPLSVADHARALRAHLGDGAPLSPGQRALLVEMLDAIAARP